jgi:UDP-glucose 4-epimerase
MHVVRSGNGHHVLVTGGAGFIGGHIVEMLLADGWHVTVVDDLSGGDRANVPPNAAFINCDITAPELDAVFAARHYDVVVHCAAQTSVPRSVANPAFDRHVNLAGTENVLACAKESGVRRVVFFSSGGAVYGDTEHRATEETLPAPLSPYGVHKLAAESYVALSGLSYAILRPANVYGPRQRSHGGTDGAVIAVFMERIARGLPVVINGDGGQVRDFVYVADVAAAVRSSLSWSSSGIWNVAGGAETTITNLATLVGQVLGVAPRIEYGPERAGDVRLSRLSIEKIVRQGLWRPEYSLAEGLTAMAAAMKAANALS